MRQHVDDGDGNQRAVDIVTVVEGAVSVHEQIRSAAARLGDLAAAGIAGCGHATCATARAARHLRKHVLRTALEARVRRYAACGSG